MENHCISPKTNFSLASRHTRSSVYEYIAWSGWNTLLANGALMTMQMTTMTKAYEGGHKRREASRVSGRESLTRAQRWWWRIIMSYSHTCIHTYVYSLYIILGQAIKPTQHERVGLFRLQRFVAESNNSSYTTTTAERHHLRFGWLYF